VLNWLLAIIEAATHEAEDIDIEFVDDIGFVDDIRLVDGKLLNKEFPEKPLNSFFLVKF
jgi:hypothetical protein